MKVLALVLLALGSAAAKGSGPYLPSGWRPDGPAFYLPSEQKPAENPLKDVILQGSEASGSDALREYGPPKVVEVSQDLVQQSLPDVNIEQAFDIKENVEAEAVVADVNEAEISSISDEAVTESQDSLASTISAEVPILILEQSTEVSNEEVEASSESNAADSDGSANSIQSISQEYIVAEDPVTESGFSIIEINIQDEKLEQVVEQEVQKLEEVVTEVQEVKEEVQNVEQLNQNVPDALAYLENGIKQVEIAQAQVDAAILENSGDVQQAPEGFLEYGPPGFREYGPPKEDLAKVSEVPLENTFESTNEARRRRFSPKFSSKKIH